MIICKTVKALGIGRALLAHLHNYGVGYTCHATPLELANSWPTAQNVCLESTTCTCALEVLMMHITFYQASLRASLSDLLHHDESHEDGGP
jgi:hypothetical protein